MLGITMRNLTRIFENPGNLHISVPQEKRSDNCRILITLGPAGKFKPLYRSRPTFKESEAIGVAKVILESICLHLGSENHPDPSKVLNTELVGRLIEDLRMHKVAKSYSN